ncbi:MAG: DPP IV N-terminal domain-containing protein, partial [Kordia sp.]|uniref:DPP IV N-terminal domain-containing protein n=1 Tax=Kordia sp. TaxID=1965332 RepID=UPI00385F770E
MKIKYVFLFLFLGLANLTLAQQKEITLAEIWSGAFRTSGMDVLHSMNNGQQYTVFNRRSGSVDKYDYKTLQKVETIVKANDLSEINSFSSYSFSDDESKLMLATKVEAVFRRSTLGIFYVYDIASKKVTKISDNKIQEPTFSPNGKKVAYVYDNNVYVKDLMSGSEIQITKDGVKNEIINGVTDWVYEEEFGFVRAFQWNAASDHIAFIRFDETNVPKFSMDVYGSKLYPQQHVFKYPKAGEKNADVSLHLYSLNANKTSKINLGNYTDFYIPRIKWTNDPVVLSVQVIN